MSEGAWTQDDRRLTAVEVAGFKSAIDPVRVNFRDITVLAGANSAGKSTVMQPLLLIKQTMEKSFDPGGLAIDGPLVRFTRADQFLSHGKAEVASSAFSVKMMQGNRQIQLSYGRSAAGGVDIAEMRFTRNSKEFTWVNNQTFKANEQSFISASDDSHFYRASRNGLASIPQIRVSRDRAMLVASVDAINDSDPTLELFPIQSPATAAVYQVQRMIYLPGLRGNPERLYVISAAGPIYPGSFNDYVASIIHRWGTTKDDKLKLLEEHLRLVGLTSHVTTRAVDDTRVEVRVGRLPVSARGNVRDTVNIADVGFGVSQTLPVLVAFLAAAPGQIVFIEQPELHLHPRAQVNLADIVLHAANRGVRVIIETHSSLLILALQTLIAEGRIAPDRVSLNWFTRDNTGQTHVAEADLAKDGSYGEWPVDFDDVELDLQNRYLNLVDRLRAEG